MELLIHVMIALSAVAYTSYAYFFPTLNKIKISYALVILTTASGGYLIWLNNALMLRACVTGLIFVGVTLTIILGANKKLAKQYNKFD